MAGENSCWRWKGVRALFVCQIGSDQDTPGHESDDWAIGKDQILDILHPEKSYESSWGVEGVVDEFDQAVGVQHHDGLSRYQKMICLTMLGHSFLFTLIYHYIRGCKDRERRMLVRLVIWENCKKRQDMTSSKSRRTRFLRKMLKKQSMLTAKARQLKACKSRLNTLAIRLSLSTCDRSKRWERSTRRASLFSIKKDRIEMRGCRAWKITMSMVQLISSGKR